MFIPSEQGNGDTSGKIFVHSVLDIFVLALPISEQFKYLQKP